MIWMWLLACNAPPGPISVPVAAALDVPPPPQQESLDIGPTTHPCEPGESLKIGAVLTSIVDCRDGVITVYAEAEAARTWLEAGTVRLTPPPP